MQLILGNTQDGMSNLEKGIHALDNVFLSEGGCGEEGGPRDCSRQIGLDHSNLAKFRNAAEVFSATRNCGIDTPFFLDKALHLAAIHKATALPVLSNFCPLVRV